MIGLTPALAFSLLFHDARGQQIIQNVTRMPSGVVLTGKGDSTTFAGLPEASKKVKSLFKFEPTTDDMLCCKTGENSFVFVRKNYPPYKRLRFRKHVIELLKRVGYNKPFQYQELASPEFEEYAKPIWRDTPELVPNPSTKVAFQVRLQSSTTVGGEPMDFVFGPGIKSPVETIQALLASQADVLTNRNDILERVKSMPPTDTQGQYTVTIDSPVSSQLSSVRSALEQFRVYYEEENSALSGKAETVLTDPIWNDTKARRKIRDMRELKEKLPKAFNFILGIRIEELSYLNLAPSQEETLALSEAPLNHQYQVTLTVFGGGKGHKLNLPI